ncbi:MAG: YlxR family protein [Actinobacteria bacterium]|nr:YlxR family protein [Actinomycetota bacterium]
MPIRTCIGCRKVTGKSGLFKVTRHSDGSLILGLADNAKNGTGRGAWLCKNSPSCIDLAIKRKAFSRALRGSVKLESIEQLKEVIVD